VGPAGAGPVFASCGELLDREREASHRMRVTAPRVWRDEARQWNISLVALPGHFRHVDRRTKREAYASGVHRERSRGLGHISGCVLASLWEHRERVEPVPVALPAAVDVHDTVLVPSMQRINSPELNSEQM
jgi:hypothetical protein